MSEEVTEEKSFWDRVLDFADDAWEGFKDKFGFVVDAAEAMYKAISKLFAEEITDALAEAAMAAVNAVESAKSDDDGLDWADYLKAAVEAVEESLSDSVKDVSKTAIVTAVQAAYSVIKDASAETSE